MKGNRVNIRTAKSWFPTDEGDDLLILCEMTTAMIANAHTTNAAFETWYDTANGEDCKQADPGIRPTYNHTRKHVEFDDENEESMTFDQKSLPDNFIINASLYFNDFAADYILFGDTSTDETFIRTADSGAMIEVSIGGTVHSISLSSSLPTNNKCALTITRKDGEIQVWRDANAIGAATVNGTITIDTIATGLNGVYFHGGFRDFSIYNACSVRLRDDVIRRGKKITEIA